jgi:hypothetical protein
MMTKSEQIQADARAAAETEMAKQCTVANIVVGQPTLVGAAPQTFKTNVRVACDDGHEHCFEWRCQTDGTLGTLWPVACPLGTVRLASAGSRPTRRVVHFKLGHYQWVHERS